MSNITEPVIINGGLATDDRGQLRFVNDFNFENVKRFYQVNNHKQGFIRAWHGHMIESKYVYVVSGCIKMCVVDISKMMFDSSKTSEQKKIIFFREDILRTEEDWVNENNVKTFYLTSDKPQILKIPSGYANGFQTLTDNAVVMFFSTTDMEQAKMDDFRFEYDFWNVWKESYR